MLNEIHWTALHERYESLDREDAKQLSRHIAAILADTLADCLKPVPVGEPCRFEDNDMLYVLRPGNGLYGCDDRTDHYIDPHETVQPVRLVPAVEALEGRNDG